MSKPIEVELTVMLQIELDKLTPEEFKEYMKGKVLVYGGKKYGYEEVKEEKTVSVSETVSN